VVPGGIEPGRGLHAHRMIRLFGQRPTLLRRTTTFSRTPLKIPRKDAKPILKPGTVPARVGTGRAHHDAPPTRPDEVAVANCSAVTTAVDGEARDPSLPISSDDPDALARLERTVDALTQVLSLLRELKRRADGAD
jgi:hypothetical protein